MERLLDQYVAAGTVGEDHHVDLGTGQKLPRLVVEEQHADVPGLHELVGPVDDVHLPAQIDQRHLARMLVEVAADFLQIRLDQPRPQVIHVGLAALAVVERHGRRQSQQFLLVFAVRLHLDGAGVAADEVVVLLRLGGDGTRGLVRAVLPARRPQHDQVLALVPLDAQDREVGRLNQVAVAQQFPLDLVELVVPAGRPAERSAGRRRSPGR